VAIITKDSLHVIDFFIFYFVADWQTTADWLLGRSEKSFAV
jgi:hypothetical protein